MKPHAQEAEVLRLLLVYSCISISDIIAWADQKIMEDPNPSGELIEISITEASNRSAMLSNLSQLAEGADIFAAIRSALGRIHDAASTLSPEELADLAKSLNNIALENRQNLPADLSFLLGLGDKFSHAVADAPDELPALSQEFLGNLKKFQGAA
ncbi:MAG TPA: hypothetical protein VK737_09685 [Opitutales bacterium]|jgi:hypothetical protein|nr:hypothetical protein [Opitutales bacterium]